MPLAWLITLTSTMIVLHIIVNRSNNCLLFAEQLQAVHITLHFHAFPTCQETARLREDAIPTILSGNKDKGTIT